MVAIMGSSGSGKSTIANGVLVKLLEHGNRKVTLLDGDIVRTHLSSELGFSKDHREINVKRIGYVASEITKNGGIALCAPIAPFKNSRNSNRKLIEQDLDFDTSEIKLEEVRNYQKKAKRRKAPGPDEIPVEFYKEMNDENLQEIVDQLNKWWKEEEEIPDEMLEARIFCYLKMGRPKKLKTTDRSHF